MRKRKFFLYIIVFIITAAAVGGFSFSILIYAKTPKDINGIPETFHVKPGQGLNITAKRLQNRGFIKGAIKFRLISFLTGSSKDIKAGEYFISSSMSPYEILEVLSKGRVKLHRVTVPEGYSIKQIAALLADEGIISDSEAFLDAAYDAPYIAETMRYGTPSLEGCLFPDTYFFPSDISYQRIIMTMASRFNKIFKDEWIDRAEYIGLTVNQVITMASIIEKETARAEERPIISSVFHNRLKKRMRLETDPTVIYGIEDFDGNLTRKHLRTYTPYNTYMIKGLPPGPICNPGIKAIEAALYPAKTNFFYFVSKRDGTHKFSTNISEHNKAVFKYQIKPNKKK